MPKLQNAVSIGVRMILRVSIILLLLTACSNISKENTVTLPLPTPKSELKTDIPNDRWVKIFFEGIDEDDNRAIDKVATNDGLTKLRETILPENDLEVRVWAGFGLFGIDGFVLRRSSANWSAVVLKRMICHGENRGKMDLQPPKSGWEVTWQKLVDTGILTLPDSSKLKNSGTGLMDGKSYVVETNYNYLYRTYQYENPDYVKLKETKQMVEISQIIADEFGLNSFSLETGGCGKNE